MSTENDLKALWNKEKGTGMPEADAVLKRAARLRQIFRTKLIIQTAALTIILAVMLFAGLRIAQRDLTTNIGLALMVAGILAYLITTNELLPMLFKSGMETSGQAYVRQLIRIQRKNQFLQRTMIDIYFLLLTIGMYLYLFQFAQRLNTLNAILCYLLPSIGLAITWSYSKRREFNKTAAPLNETIQQLESLDAQMHDN